MPHIHTKDGQHDQVADAFIFRTDFDETKIMLHMHRKLHSYMQFGGHIELDEHPMQTMKHELKEETGYDLEQLEILQPELVVPRITGVIVHPIPAVYATHHVVDEHYHTALCYALVTDQEPASSPAKGESKEFKLLTRDEVENLPTELIIDNVRETVLYLFDQILNKWETVSLDQFDH